MLLLPHLKDQSRGSLREPDQVDYPNKQERELADELYFLATGGGITFGGGEPLLQSEFVKEVLELGGDVACPDDLPGNDEPMTLQGDIIEDDD